MFNEVAEFLYHRTYLSPLTSDHLILCFRFCITKLTHPFVLHEHITSHITSFMYLCVWVKGSS